jgi:hypothetical protein
LPSAVFDDENLVSVAGLVPVLALAERAGLSELIEAKVQVGSNRVPSAGVNPVGKLTAIIAGMAAGADCIDDLEVIRSGGMGKLFDGVYAAATLGQFLREFTFGHVAQLASVARAHLVNLIGQVPGLLPGIETRALVDIDSLLRPVYGHAKEGASFGHAKVSGRAVLPRALAIGDHDQRRGRGAGAGRAARIGQGCGLDGARGGGPGPCCRCRR